VKIFKPKSPLAGVNTAQAAIYLIAFVAVLGLLYGWLTSGDAASATPAQAVQPHSLSGLRAPSLLAAGSHPTDTTSRTSAALQALSLSGTEADGDWAVDANGELQPSINLRRRFDYYLTLQGETPLEQVATHLRTQVQAAHGAKAAQQVMDLWARYLRLQQHAWAMQVDLQRPDTWAAALAERSAVRRQLLGLAWAEAFYRAEEDELRALITQTQDGQTAGNSAAPGAVPVPDAAQREAQVEAQWQQWSQRIDAARSQVQQLRQAPELSEMQRNAAIDAYLGQQFSGSELVRARALLQI
jgi:lipase chaperone LimK